MEEFEKMLLIFSLGIGGGYLGTRVARGVSGAWGIVNHPNPIVPQHIRPVAYLGGVGIFLGAVFVLVSAGALGWVELGSRQWNILLPGILFLGLGLYDDLRRLAPAPKFCLQILAAILAVLCGNRASPTGVVLLDNLASVIWMVTLINAFNFTDVCDGLVGGLGCLAFLFLTCLTNGPTSWLPLALAGSCLGFLFLNFPPATIFLGDGGSHLIGYMVASLSLNLVGQGWAWPHPAQAFLVAGVPLFELVFISAVRLHKGLPWWLGSPDHFSLRLQEGGFSRLQTDLIAWGIALILGTGGIMLEFLSPIIQIGILGAVAGGLFIFGGLLLRWEVPARAGSDLHN